MLKLGCAARYKYFSPSELEQLTAIGTSCYFESDYLATEGSKDISSEYQHVNTRFKPKNDPSRVHKVQGSPLTPTSRNPPSEDADGLSEKSDDLHAFMPTFSVCLPHVHFRYGDEDFHIAMSMVEVLIGHSLLLSSSLLDMALKSRPLESFHQTSAILTHLPLRFSYTKFANETIKDEMSKSTSKRVLKRSERF